jgi:cytochrome c biogenesis protein CcmG, thiol:disulfide interchange protein DsbE
MTGRGRHRSAAGGVLLAAMLAATVPVPAASVDAGARAPAMEASALRPGAAPVSLERLQGRVVYVDFWASWCVPCRSSMPALEELVQRYQSRGFTVVGVNKDASLTGAERFLRQVPVTFLLVSDADDAIAKAFGVTAMPSGYLLDRRGVVRRVHRGYSKEIAAALESEIAALLEERP